MNSPAQAIERIKATARLVLAAGLGLALLLAPPRGTPLFPLVAFFFGVYFLYAVVALGFHRRLAGHWTSRAAVAGDAAALMVVLLLAPTHPAAFLLFFVYFALVAGFARGLWAAAALGVLVSVAYLWLAGRGTQPVSALGVFSGLVWGRWAVAAGLTAVGSLVGTLAERGRRQVERVAEVERFLPLLSLERRWPELWQGLLEELCRCFRARRALLVCRDPETDRVTVWQVGGVNPGRGFEEAERPPSDARMFLLDEDKLVLLGNELAESGGRWHLRRADGAEGEAAAFRLPERFREEFQPRSLLSLPLGAGGSGAARLFLLDAARGGFSAAEREKLERLLEGLGPALANLLSVRNLMAQALNQEHERISRELHDSVAQTLASLEMQLEVVRRQAVREPERTAAELARLQGVVKQEQEALRRYLHTLKPVRVPAAELRRWVVTHCARFQEETGIEVEVDAAPVDSALPEGICREVFFLLREALHNVRKHAEAHHVTVRLRQDEAYLRLLVDDDGRGFPFSGVYSLPALEESGLAPVSVAEHTRALGGTLTIESMPGSGATLRVDIPLG